MLNTSGSKSYVALILSAAAGLVLFLLLYYLPLLSGNDPEASAHRINRAGAEEAAVHFVQEQIPQIGELKAFGIYSAEREAFGYLYSKKAIEQFTELYQERLPLELYRVEVLETETGARHTVDVNPYTGKPAEWSLQQYGDLVPEGEMIKKAEQALKEQGLLQISSLSSADPYTGEVVYNISVPELKGASAQAALMVDDNGIYSQQMRWNTTDAYGAIVKRQDFLASILGTSGLALSAAMQLAAIIYAARFNSIVSWRRGAVLSVIFAVLYCIANINMYPAVKAMMLQIGNGEDYVAFDSGEDTTGSLIGLIFGLGVTNLVILFMAVGLYFSMVAGVQLCRRRGWQLWPSGSETGYGAQTVSSMWKGYAFAFIMLGVQAVIFLGAEQGFGTWYTIDAATSSHNLLYPALMPVLAWCAAISEEGVYRLFGIPALKVILRFTFPAVLASSFIWSLGHVQYPIYPYYTRLVEVTLIGLLFSYIFLKHGFMTAVFAHATADTIWMGISITANHPSAANFSFAIGYLLLPIVIAYGISLFTRRARNNLQPL